MPRLPEKIIIPVGVDIHDHFREPSLINQAETFVTGTLAALEGGYLVTNDMPNSPGIETWTFIREIDKQQRIRRSAYGYVGTYAGSQPESDNVGELGPMSQISVGLKVYLGKTTGYSRDLSIKDVMPALRQWNASAPDKPIMVHRGNADLEEIIALVAMEMNHPLHICHVNSVDEVQIIVKAKSLGLPVTCGVCPHHLFMTSHDVMTKGAMAEMQPPLVRQEEAEALWRLLVNGDIDVIETDHAPHPIENKYKAEHSKGCGESVNCFGVPGVKETIPQMLNQVRLGTISLERVVQVTSTKPAEIIGIKLGSRTLTTWTNELHQIGDADSEAAYASPYIGNFAVGRVLSVTDGGRELLDPVSGFRRVKRPVLLPGALI